MMFFLLIVAIIGIIVQHAIDFGKLKTKSKKHYGLIILAVSLIGVLGSNLTQYFDSMKLQANIDSLQYTNNEMNKKLDSYNQIISSVRNELDSVKSKSDSLLLDNKYLKYILGKTEENLLELGKKTEKGFIDNQKSIKEIKQVAVKNIRTVPENIRELMIVELSKYKGKSVKFLTVNEGEALKFSEELQNVYRKAGWTVKNEILLAPGPKAIGIGFEINPEYESNVLASYQLLSLLNYKLVPIRKSEIAKDGLNIVIGFQE